MVEGVIQGQGILISIQGLIEAGSTVVGDAQIKPYGRVEGVDIEVKVIEANALFGVSELVIEITQVIEDHFIFGIDPIGALEIEQGHFEVTD